MLLMRNLFSSLDTDRTAHGGEKKSRKCATKRILKDGSSLRAGLVPELEIPHGVPPPEMAAWVRRRSQARSMKSGCTRTKV